MRLASIISTVLLIFWACGNDSTVDTNKSADSERACQFVGIQSDEQIVERYDKGGFEFKLDGKLDGLKTKIGKLEGDVGANLVIGKIDSVKERITKGMNYQDNDKVDTYNMTINLLCTVQEMTRDTNLTEGAREEWNQILTYQVNELFSFLLGHDTSGNGDGDNEGGGEDGDEGSKEVRDKELEGGRDSDESSNNGLSLYFTWEISGKALYISGSYKKQAFNPDNELLWVFLHKQNNYYSQKNNSKAQVIASRQEWETSLDINVSEPFTRFYIYKFDKKQENKLKDWGTGGRSGPYIENLGGELMAYDKIDYSSER